MPPIKSYLATFERQHQVDPERALHSVDLYAVWCAKSYVLNRSAELNPFGTKYFLYVDAGAFRSANYRFRAWPHPSTISTVFKNDRFFLGMITPLPRRFCTFNYTMMDGPIKTDLIEGTFMGGSASAIRWWTSVYYATINDYRAKDFFIDVDTLVLGDISHLHELVADPSRTRFEFAAVADNWHGQFAYHFNAGVLVLHPSIAVFKELLRTSSFEGNYAPTMAEQAFLNAFFQLRYLELPIIYNVNLALYLAYPDLWKRMQPDFKIVHYTLTKPFLTKSDSKMEVLLKLYGEAMEEYRKTSAFDQVKIKCA
ncbi:unnamed protein product [Adineta steineri]|uniref:glycogenin glucosyltransferase n=1 Tax=Adineta steineri TaxID=433720 RepID=A0A814QXK3_9BILA|nr:unnamed protein product [Adineta steineri]